jgi:uncharacterized phiE125 gp8 family phage protein
MPIEIIIEPVSMAVTLTEARTAARINGTDSDSEIEIDVRAITTAAEHATARACIYRTCRVTLDAFPVVDCDGLRPIVVDSSPLSSVVALKYFDIDGAEQTLDPADYIVDVARKPGRITPAVGLTWPVTQSRPSAVNVDVICGCGPDSASTPSAFKGYILGKVAEKHAPAGTPESTWLPRLLDSLKVY